MISEQNASDLPTNLEAEQGLLGTLMINIKGYEEIAGILTRDHFHWPVHGRIYAAIEHFIIKGQSPTPLVLKNYFQGETELDAAGGEKYLAAMAAEAPMINTPYDYARNIIDMAQRREMIYAANALIDQAKTPDYKISARQIIEDTETRLYNIAEYGTDTRPGLAAADSVDQTIKLIEKMQTGAFRGVPTGIDRLDAHLTGLHAGEMTVVAGRPGMGKTVFAMTAALNAAQAGYNVAFFSLEMAHELLSMRILSRMTGIPTGVMRREGALYTDSWPKLLEARSRLAAMPLILEDMPGLAPGHVMTRARRHKRKRGLDMIIIDYLGLMESPTDIPNQAVRISEITKAVKSIARELNVPVMLLCQINRGVESRDDKRPTLADLRDSGSIEQDADNVLFLYRDEYYLAKFPPKRKEREDDARFNDRYAEWEARLQGSRGQADIIVAKQRMGAEGTITTGFNANRQEFFNL